MTESRLNPFSAAGSAAGYLFQCRWALVAFLRRLDPGENFDLAIEKLDDLSFEANGTSIELIQTKHHLQAAANLTDSSPDLWKTIRVWAVSLRGGVTRVPGVLLSLVTTSTAQPDSIAAMLRPDGRDVPGATARLVAVAQDSHSSVNKPAYDAFLGLSAAERAALVEAIYVSDQAPNAADLPREITRLVQHAADDAHLAAFVERLEGWWLDRVVEHLTGADTGAILGADLRLKLSDLRHSFQPDNLPLDYVLSDPPEGADPTGDDRVFVNQLRIIATNNDRIRFAIIDYYRAYAQRSRWLREDLVHAGELTTYERRLIEELHRRRAVLADEGPPPQTEDEKQAHGRRLYSWVENTAHLPIRDKVTEPFVMRGSYHMLADNHRIGWHPDFIDRLRDLVRQTSAGHP